MDYTELSLRLWKNSADYQGKTSQFFSCTIQNILYPTRFHIDQNTIQKCEFDFSFSKEVLSSWFEEHCISFLCSLSDLFPHLDRQAFHRRTYVLQKSLVFKNSWLSKKNNYIEFKNSKKLMGLYLIFVFIPSSSNQTVL